MYSGATTHMTWDKGVFVTYAAMEDMPGVRLGDGRTVKAEGKGSVCLRIRDNKQIERLINLSRQCKGCRTGESLRRQGAAQRGGSHSWDIAQSQERHRPTGQSRRRHHPGLTPDWLRAHAHFHSAPAQRLLRQLIRMHPTPSWRSLVLRYIVFSSLVSLLGKGESNSTVWLLPRKRLLAKGKHVCTYALPASTGMCRPRAFGVHTCSSHAAPLLRPRLDRSGWPHDGHALPRRTKMTTT